MKCCKHSQGIIAIQWLLTQERFINEEQWYKDTRKKIIPVHVLGAPTTEAEMKESPSPPPERKPEAGARFASHTGLRILVDIRMSNGVHISQKNLSYEGLKSLVEKLEGLC